VGVKRMVVADRKLFQKMRLNDMNVFDTERTVRENIYQLEQEDIRIEELVEEMINEKIPISIILDWLRQMEDNAGEVAFLNTLLQLNVQTYDFSSSTIFKRGVK
jgi:hypothetical protein